MAFNYPVIKDLNGNIHKWQLVQEEEINENNGIYYNNKRASKYVLARYNYSLRNYVKNIHNETKVTYKEMAKIIGVSPDWLSGWLIWRSEASWEKLAKLEHFVLNAVYHPDPNYVCWCDDSVLAISDSITFEESYNQRTWKKLRGLQYVK